MISRQLQVEIPLLDRSRVQYVLKIVYAECLGYTRNDTEGSVCPDCGLSSAIAYTGTICFCCPVDLIYMQLFFVFVLQALV